MSQSVPDNKFLGLIAHLTDLPLSDKIKILEYCADELMLQDDNLKLLEYKIVIKELKDELAKTGK